MLGVAILLLSVSLLSLPRVVANTGCPGSTSTLGDITLTGTCTVDTDTTWASGTITISGDVVVLAGVTLTTVDVIFFFPPSFTAEFGFEIWGTLDMQGGGAQSTTASHFDFVTAAGSTVTIDSAEFATGRYDFSWAVADVGYSTFRDSDMTDGLQHLWVGAYSRFHHNVLRGISLSEGAAIVVYENWGETSIWGNELHLNCYGNNCMGVEVINMKDGLVTPGFPVVEVAWNNITWEDVGAGDWAISFDNEFSSRLWIHNNTQYVNATGETVGNCLQAGGVRHGSVYEYNTCYGPTDYGIWDYIYADTDNVFQYNYFEDVQYGGIWQMGTATIAHNTFVDVSRAGIWVCETGASCAGSSAAVVDNRWYDNSFTYTAGAYLARASLANFLDNTLIHHGNGQATQWMEGSSGPYHTVPGEGNWLYWADQDIERLEFANASDGTRTVTMRVAGVDYPSEYVGFGAVDSASLAVSGFLDKRGSSNYDDSGTGTFLRSLGPQRTEIDVLATGSTTYTVENFAADWNYSVAVSGPSYETPTFTTDGSGSGFFSTTQTGQLNVVISAEGSVPPPPPDGTPPAQVSDLEVVVAGSDYAILQWRAPGDDGSSGQASTYDLRHSAAGPLDEANFGSATPVPMGAPLPAGSTERINVTGLSPNTTYWFALRTADEIPNWSPLSNVVNATLLPVGEVPKDDSTPPTVTITAPAHEAIVSGDVQVLINATDDTAVAGVTILVDLVEMTTLTTSPYAWTWRTGALATGTYVLTAEATDLQGNRGSHQISVALLGQEPEEPIVIPFVEEARYDVPTTTLNVGFSKPMNRTSVEAALGLEPVLPFNPVWTDDEHLQLVLETPPADGIIYVLIIEPTATDLEGVALAERFTYGFDGAGTANPGGASDLWLQALGVLAAGWVIVLVLFLRSRRGMRDLRASVRELAHQLQAKGVPTRELEVLESIDALDVPRY